MQVKEKAGEEPFGSRCSPRVGITGRLHKAEAEMAIVAGLAAIGADVENPAKNGFEKTVPAGFINKRTLTLWTNVLRMPREDKLHNYT